MVWTYGLKGSLPTYILPKIKNIVKTTWNRNLKKEQGVIRALTERRMAKRKNYITSNINVRKSM